MSSVQIILGNFDSTLIVIKHMQKDEVRRKLPSAAVCRRALEISYVVVVVVVVIAWSKYDVFFARVFNC